MSWCGQECIKLHAETARLEATAAKDIILSDECEICREERGVRKLVASSSDDKRFREEKFRKAPAIFPNNSVKYDVNKMRARTYAAEGNLPITWSQARDTPSQKVLQGRTNLKNDKEEWLTWHDKDCGDLYGMLPLVQGMPVMLEDHVSRSQEYSLLRGKIGQLILGCWIKMKFPFPFSVARIRDWAFLLICTLKDGIQRSLVLRGSK